MNNNADLIQKLYKQQTMTIGNGELLNVRSLLGTFHAELIFFVVICFYLILLKNSKIDCGNKKLFTILHFAKGDSLILNSICICSGTQSFDSIYLFMSKFS